MSPISKNDIPGDSYFDNSKILGVIGHYRSAYTWEAGEIYGSETLNNEKIVLISPTSTGNRKRYNGNDRRNLNSYVFRTASNDMVASGDLAEYIWNKLQLRKKVLIFFDSDDRNYSISMYEAFKNEIVTFSVNPNNYINHCDLRTQPKDYCAKLAKNIEAQALIFFPGSGNSGTLKEARESINNIKLEKQNFKVLAGDALSDQETLNLKQAADGIIIAVPFHAEKAPKPFKDQSKNLWGIEQVSWRTITSYDATQVFLKALTDLSDNSTKTRQDIYNKLIGNSFSAPGAVTNIMFDEGDRKLVTGVGVLVQVAQTKPNSDEYEFKLLETPQRNNS
jgi:ABC-type branched-subunit amino acid transport system substrate-binding protein